MRESLSNLRDWSQMLSSLLEILASWFYSSYFLCLHENGDDFVAETVEFLLLQTPLRLSMITIACFRLNYTRNSCVDNIFLGRSIAIVYSTVSWTRDHLRLGHAIQSHFSEQFPPSGPFSYDSHDTYFLSPDPRTILQCSSRNCSLVEWNYLSGSIFTQAINYGL